MRHSIVKAITHTACGLILASGLTGCGASKNVIYLQDATPEKVMEVAERTNIKIEPGDEIMVYVSSTDSDLAGRLSLLSGTRAPAVSGSGAAVYSSQVMLPYTVNEQGYINMPLIGQIKVQGLTRQEISKLVEKKIEEKHLAIDGNVNVTVQFANLTFTAIGEIARTGTYAITKDDLTLIEALSMAGDLTIHGRRDRVWVIREEPDGGRKMFQVDLRDSSFLQSPAYRIQQNDVIYVEPNGVRAGQSTLNENTFKSVGFWTSLASVAMSIATFAVTLSR